MRFPKSPPSPPFTKGGMGGLGDRVMERPDDLRGLCRMRTVNYQVIYRVYEQAGP